MFIYGLDGCIEDTALMTSQEVFSKSSKNVGNLAFNYAVEKMLRKDKREKLPTIPWETDVEIINKLEGVGVIPLANQIGQHLDLAHFSKKFEKIDKKLLGVGLGAQGSINYDIPTIPKGSIDWIEQLVLHGGGEVNITTRGEFTQKVLAHYGFEGKTISLGCPSLFINSNPSLGKKLEVAYNNTEFSKIAIAAGHPAWHGLRKNERSLIEIMRKFNGDYIVQADPNMIAMSRNAWSEVNPEFLEKLRCYICPELNKKEFILFARNKFISFFNITAWMEYLRRYDFIVGSRFHGVMLAIQAGVPGLCIAHDSRIRELCEKSKIP